MFPIKIISLLRSSQRRADFIAANPDLLFEFFDAVDGLTLADRDINEPKLFDHGLPYSKGAYGCALSHLTLWNAAIRSGQPLTIGEDDAIFRPDFVQMQEKAMAGITGEWDLITWGWNFNEVLLLDVLPGVSPTIIAFKQDQLRQSIETFRQINDWPKLYRLRLTCGLPAYTISPAGAAKFISKVFPLRNTLIPVPELNAAQPNTGIDLAMAEIYPVALCYASLPPLVVTKNEKTRSTIQD